MRKQDFFFVGFLVMARSHAARRAARTTAARRALESLAQGDAEAFGYGHVALLCRLASPRAHDLALRLAAGPSLLVRSLLPSMAGSFPTPEFLALARRAAPLSAEELHDRMSALHPLDSGQEALPSQARALGAAASVLEWRLPALEYLETPRAALQRLEHTIPRRARSISPNFTRSPVIATPRIA